MVKEKLRNLRKKEKSQGILTGIPNVKVSPHLKLNFNAVFCENAVMVMENSLRSGRSQGKVRENENRKNGRPVVQLGRPSCPQ